MRLFTAIDIPDEIRHALGATIGRLRPSAKISWTNPEKLHITTKFIGDWSESRLEEVKAVLKSVGSPGAIRITVADLGYFPDARHPHTFWAGVKASPELAVLAHSTENAVAALGVAKEDRKFSPHLTLARIRDRSHLGGLRSAVEALGAPEFGSFTPAAFYLYESKDGTYTKLAEFPLIP